MKQHTVYHRNWHRDQWRRLQHSVTHRELIRTVIGDTAVDTAATLSLDLTLLTGFVDFTMEEIAVCINLSGPEEKITFWLLQNN
jgi:hypothetical protein